MFAQGELLALVTVALGHELIEPLAAISSRVHTARCALAAQKLDLGRTRAAIEDIARDTKRAIDSVDSMKAILQHNTVEMSPVSIEETIHNVGRIIRADAALKKIIVRVDLPKSLPSVVGNKTQLIQAIMNLVVNAFEAIGEDDTDVREVKIAARQHELGRVHITVSDSGKGKAPEVMPRLFEPFFTTKPRGLGVGLAIVRSIVESHRGHVRVIPNRNRGAPVEFDLPASE